MDDRLDGIERIKNSLTGFEVFLGSVQILESLLDVRYVREGIDVCVLGVVFVDFIGQRSKEG